MPVLRPRKAQPQSRGVGSMLGGALQGATHVANLTVRLSPASAVMAGGAKPTVLVAEKLGSAGELL